MSGLACRAARAPAVLALALAGCVLLPVTRSREGRSIDLKPAQVAPGRTTRADLLKVLGPPAAVAAPGQYVTVPTMAPPSLPPYRPPATDPARAWVAQAETWFALFPSHAPPAPGQRIYYWATTTGWGLLFVMPSIVSSWDFWELEELWALVDEERGVVLEVVRRTGG